MVPKIALIDDAITSKIILNTQTQQLFIDDKYRLSSLNISDSVNNTSDTHADICSKIIRKYLPNCSLLNIVVKDHNTLGDFYKLLTALEYLQYLDIDIINLSIGFTSRLYALKLYPIIKKLINRNIIIVAAHSNNDSITYPASFKNVIGCKALSSVQKNHLKKSIFYASGSHMIRLNSGKPYITPNVNSYATAYITSLVSNSIL